MPIKNIFRIITIITAALVLTLFLDVFLQWETILNQEVSLVLPAAVYVSPDNNLQFTYADMFHTYMLYLEDGELQYHIDLLTDRTDIHGYVEVWETGSSLSVFLEKTKASFSPTVKNFTETVPNNDYNTRIWEYDIAEGIHVKQYFSQQQEKLIVVSLFAPTGLWSEKYNTIFEEIRESVTLQ